MIDTGERQLLFADLGPFSTFPDALPVPSDWLGGRHFRRADQPAFR